MTAPDGPLAAYRALRRAGKLTGDPQQELAAEKLETLHRRLRHYRPGEESAWAQFLSFGRKREPAPQGLYIYGAVGRGKSMLMDLFFAGAPVARKRRVHFHAFMQEVHEAIFRWRQLDPAARGGDDPIRPVAKQIAREAWLLCFDEFQVTDVADAMILGRLFQKLFDRGVVVVATSNSAPDELYRAGINRPLFLPFIELFKQKLDVLHLAGATDYRLSRLAGSPVWHTPLGPPATAALDAAFAALTDEAAGAPAEIEVQGRRLIVPKQARQVAQTTFPELCERPLGPADYLALAGRYHTLILDQVPVLRPEQKNPARRLIILVDALYEAKTKLIAAAEATPDRLLHPEAEGRFEFARTASRLAEMQSAGYWALEHRGG